MSTVARPPQPPAPPPPPHPHAPQSLVDSEGFIDDHIRRTRRSLKAVDLASTVLTLVIGVLAFLFVAGMVDHWVIPGGLGPGGRIAMFGLMVAGVAWYGVRQFGPLVRSINPVYAAHTIEQSAPTLKNSLLNVLLFRTHRQGMSAKVYHALEQQAAQRLSASAADAAIDHSALLRLGYVLLAVIAACAIYAVASPKNLAVSAARVIAPWTNLAAPSRVQILDVQPGDSTVAIGERVHVSAEILALHTDEPVRVYYSTADEAQVDESILMTRPTSAGRHSADLPRASDVSRGTGAPGGDVGVQQDLEYWVEAGDAVSRRYKLTVFERPTIVVQRVRYTYPTYTGEPTQTVEGVGDVRGLEGTDVTIEALASQDIKSANVDFDSDGTSDARMTVDGRRAAASFRLQLREDRRTPWHQDYTLRFTSTAGRSNEDPAQYKLEVLPDYAPEVQITKPEEPEVTVRVDETVAIAVEARDPDFAVADVRLVGRVGDREIVLGQLLAGRTHAGLFKQEHSFKPDDAELKAGDVVEYWAEARDNRAPDANLGFSVHRRLRIVGDEQPGGEQQQPGDGGGAQGDNGGQGDAGDQGANGGQGENQNQDGGANQQGDGGEQGDGGQGGAEDAQQDGGGGQQNGEGGQQQGENQQGQAGGGAGGGSEGEGQSQNGEGATGQGSGGSGQEGQQQDGAQQDGAGGGGQQGDQTGADGQTGDQTGRGGQPGGEQSQDGDQQGGEQQGENVAGGSPNGGQQQTGAGRQPGAPNENAGGGGQSERVSPDGVNDGEVFDRIRQQMAEKDGTEEFGENEESQGADGQAGDQGEQPAGGGQEQQARDGAAGQNSAAGQNASGQPGGEQQGDANAADQTGDEQSGDPQGGDQTGEGQTGDAGENASANPGAEANPEAGGQTAGQRTGRDGEQASGANTPRDETDPNSAATSEGDGETPAGADNAANANNGEAPAGDQNAGQPGAPDATNKNPNDQGRGDEGGQSGAPEEAPTGDARGRDESQARGESSGDRAGEGQRGGGQQADNAGEGEAGTHQAADTGQGQSADQGEGEAGTEAGDQQTAEGQTGQSSGNQRGAGSETRDAGEQQGRGGENGDQQEQPGDAGAQDGQQGDNQQQGAGDQGAAGQQPQRGGDQNPAGGQQPGNEQQPGGEQGANPQGGDQQGDQQGGQDPAGGQQPGGQQAAGSNNAGAQQPDSQQAGGQQQPGDGEQQTGDQPPQNPSRDGSTGQGGAAANPTGGTSGGGVDGDGNITEPGGDKANLEYAKRQTDLVLERLSDQLAKQDVDKDLLKRLGWTEDELRQFVERWKKLKTEAAAEADTPGEATARLDDAIRSIQVRPMSGRRVEGTAAADDLQINDSFRGRAPLEWYERTRAYMKGVSSEGR